MKINTKVRYGLRVMIEISRNHSNGILQKKIAESQGIPLPYLDSIITSLRTSGLIVNFSGKSSGYILAKPANEITVYDVYRAFEPDLSLVYCINPISDCSRESICSTKDYWAELNDQLKQILERTVLEELVVKAK
jgi:Rrf2 family protein